MAAIDVIQNMSNYELVKYYKYCMVNRFQEHRLDGVHYHPDYAHCSVYVGENKLYNLHYSNEESLLNMMWDRMINDSFVNQCWWLSQKIFQTKISLPFKATPRVFTVYESKKETEIISFNNDVFELLGRGTKRKAYLSPCKTYVIKVPTEPYELGILENKTEANTYLNNPDGIYAKCELIENDWLKMEYVKPAFFTKDDEYPEWTLNIAEHQVGYNLEGKLVAYDYGSDI